MPEVTTSDQVRREDLSDALILADVRNVTLLPRLRKGPTLEAPLYAWGVEKSNARRAGGIPEGSDVNAFEGDAFKKLYNRKNKFWRTPMVTTEAEKLKGITGQSQDFAGQKAKKIKEQARDIETEILSDQDTHEDDGVLGDKFFGLGRVVNDTTSVGMTGAALPFGDSQTAIPGDYRTPTPQIYSGTLVNFHEADMNAILQSRFDQLGGSPELTLFAGSLLKSHISGEFGRYVPNVNNFTAIVRTQSAQIDAKKLLSYGIDVFEGDFGVIDITVCSYMPFTNRGYILAMEDMQMRPLAYCDFMEIPDQGAGMRGLIQSILGYEYGNPLKHAKIDPSA